MIKEYTVHRKNIYTLTKSISRSQDTFILGMIKLSHNWSEGPLDRREFMLATVNLSNHLWLMELRDKPIQATFLNLCISNYTLNLYPYAYR